MNYLLVLLSLAVVNNALGQRGSSCTTPNRRNGICTKIRSCEPLFKLIQRRPIPNNVTTFLRASQCGTTGNEPDVCCPVNRNNVKAEKMKLLPNLTSCGQDVEDRIYGGTEASLQEFPWMALLEYTKPVGSGFYCGGALISERYILTAAHCVANPAIPKTWRINSVRLGEHNLKTDPDCDIDYGCNPQHLDVAIESMKYHELYDATRNAQQNDIALLRLATPVTFTDNIQPICLPIQNQNLMNTNHLETSPFIAGWGKTENSSLSDIKLKVRLPVVNLDSCKDKYKTMGIELGSKQLCAGGELNKDSCRGDSGGPLMIKSILNGQDGNWYSIGIASFGPSPCGLEDWGGVYTKVNEFTDWILNNIEP